MARQETETRSWERWLPLSNLVELLADSATEFELTMFAYSVNLDHGRRFFGDTLEDLRSDLTEISDRHVDLLSVTFYRGAGPDLHLKVSGTPPRGKSSAFLEVEVRGTHHKDVYAAAGVLDRGINDRFRALDDAAHVPSTTGPEAAVQIGTVNIDRGSSFALSGQGDATSTTTNLSSTPDSKPVWWQRSWLVNTGTAVLAAVVAGVVIYVLGFH